MSYVCPAISQEYAQAVANTYQQIFRIVCHHGYSTLGEMDSISGADHRAIISWNPLNPFDSEEYHCMHRLVELKVREVPKAEAVFAWDGSLTYQELDDLADLAAQRLVQAGVRPGTFVPFAYEKTKWAVIASLAILKAGGAFVPINPNDPVSRLAELLAKVNAIVVVTMEKFIPTFGPLVETVIVISDEVFGADKAHDKTVNGCMLQRETQNGSMNHMNPPHQVYTSNGLPSAKVEEVKPTDPMIVMFTSGSTGQPKGIVLEHRAICTHALVHGSKMGYHNSRVLQFAAHTFDVAIMDYFTTLLFGGCICIPSEEERKSDIIGVINRMKVDYALLTPSFAGLIDPSEVPTMRTLAIGGEALPQDRVQRWSENVNLIQVYGPAEVGICLTMDMKIDTAPETVGFPLRSCSCWLVDPDDYDVLVPIGTVGELMIAGPSLARGYINNDAKTRASFINKPRWASKLGLKFERFYLSGDLLRYNTNLFDGSYDIIGRKDAQIKLRGQRIEPAEIEYHVGKIAGVVVSMATRPVTGSLTDQLVCVVQMQEHDSKSSRVRDEPIRLSASQDLTAKHLRKQLSQVLPSYMIPSACLTIDVMPLVPSLKIDRRRVNAWLSNVETASDWTDVNQMTPILATEATALTLSQNISSIVAANDEKRRSALQGNDFGLQSIGITSIQIISLSMYLQREYSTKIPMEILLSSDLTVRKLAQMIERLKLAKANVTNGDHPDDTSMDVMSPPIDLAQEIQTLTAKLFESVSPPITQSPYTQKRAPFNHNIFLTGATGYLGSIILHRLLQKPHNQIFVLVRCPTQQEGLDRMIAAAQTYRWWDPSHTSRIHIWPGDLTAPNLSLSPSNLALLSGSTPPTSPNSAIHTIIHNGARVHYSSSYTTLLPTNITPTLTLLRLCANSPHIKTFIFVSGGLNPSTPFPPPSALLAAAGGYAQTKHVSATLVQACRTHPAFCSKALQIVQPGYIIGGTATGGVANTADFIWRLVSGCVEIGAFNQDEADHWLFVADVEEVAETVVSDVISPHFKNDDIDDEINPNDSVKKEHEVTPSTTDDSVKRVLTGLPFSTLWRLLQEQFGYKLEPLPHEIWLGKLKERVLEEGAGHGLFPLLHVLEWEGGKIGVEGWGESEGREKDEKERVERAVEANVRFLIGVGMLPAANGVTVRGEE